MTLSVRVQVVLYGHTRDAVANVLASIAASARRAAAAGRAGAVTLAFGDSSPAPVLDAGDADPVLHDPAESEGLAAVTYQFFGANLGSAGGSNLLAQGATEDVLLVLNPDTYATPNLIANLLAVFDDPTVGAADARQIPMEHPKAFDLRTGDTSWLSGSCLAVRRSVFEQVGGFDAEHFFLYCDDVDLSWRIRLAGYRTVHVPTASVFHDKRMQASGAIVATDLEGQYGALGRLALATKFARPDIVEETLNWIDRTDHDGLKAAGKEWRRRVASGELPKPIPAAEAESVAQFVDGEYAVHRF